MVVLDVAGAAVLAIAAVVVAAVVVAAAPPKCRNLRYVSFFHCSSRCALQISSKHDGLQVLRPCC